ncbi:Gamma-glutamyl phosphate reductase [Rosistilla carotiformis]|uniref:Gamma-glutamyl phosphate reductase n=1 Tax=Rosistilla carotiformis TaxID=2528017 RepID=A0A518JPB3_9BACT|nr:glutamate-5-semialdehyde dehydrogenase [Rosistilla carotiformis]QDV67390.1 Gamma-glutamyl phosphate reductase [Rosistilla carotiformis]
MTTAETPSLKSYCLDVAERAHRASRQLSTLSTEIKNRWLLQSADALLQHEAEIQKTNTLDLQAAAGFGLTDAEVDRLRLTSDRIAAIAKGLREIAALPDPIGQVIEGFRRPNGLQIIKRRVPLGVVFFIYESRPNVTADAAAICVKSGNAVILRGGKEAAHSSAAIVEILNKTAAEVGLPADAVQLVSTADRDAVGHFLEMHELIDVTIPRGGESLIRRVASEATMPVIKHYDGNCHVYVDRDANLDQAVEIAVNSKCHRMGVCNACESLLVHRDVADAFLPQIAAALAQHDVEIVGDPQTCQRVPAASAATEADWSTEYLGPKISVRVVDDLESAIEHINRYGSHHTDAIVTKDLAASERFTDAIDSAAVMVNASTRFNDGGEFGLGAEIGISTDKFHARGPCGLTELTSYKYVVNGQGQVRS